MAGTVCQFVKRCAVILSSFRKLGKKRKSDAVAGGLIEGSVTFLMLELDAASFAVVVNNDVGGVMSVGGVGKFFLMLGLQPFALIDVEDVEVAEEGNLLLFFGVRVFLFDELPEDHHGGFLAFFHFAAFLLALGEGDVFAGPSQKHLIEKAVAVPGDVADGVAAGNPRLLPRDDTVFELGHDAVGDFLVDIHMLYSFLLKREHSLCYNGCASRFRRSCRRAFPLGAGNTFAGFPSVW